VSIANFIKTWQPVPDKMSLMRQAATDPLFLSDLKEVNGDFDGIQHETP